MTVKTHRFDARAYLAELRLQEGSPATPATVATLGPKAPETREIPQNRPSATLATVATVRDPDGKTVASVATVATSARRQTSSVSAGKPSTVATVATVARRRPHAPDLAAFEERAAILEHDEGLPRTEAETQAASEAGFASAADLHGALCRSWLAGVEAMAADESDRRGRRHIATARAFLLGGWGERALAAGWTELDLFGLHPVARWERLDTMGAAWLAVSPADITTNDIRLGNGLRLRREAIGVTAALPWTVGDLDKTADRRLRP